MDFFLIEQKFDSMRRHATLLMITTHHRRGNVFIFIWINTHISKYYKLLYLTSIFDKAEGSGEFQWAENCFRFSNSLHKIKLHFTLLYRIMLQILNTVIQSLILHSFQWVYLTDDPIRSEHVSSLSCSCFLN